MSAGYSSSQCRAYAPTDALPGTPAKIEVMSARAALRLPVFHPGDARVPMGREQPKRNGHDALPERPLPVGVSRRGYRFRARAKTPGGKRISLGCFATVEEAARAVAAWRADMAEESRKSEEETQ